MKGILPLFFIVFFTFSTYSLGADSKGQFALKGAARESCERYVEARTTKSQDYLIYVGWIEGFITGFNQFQNKNFDITPWQTTELMSGLLESHCKKAPKDGFFFAVSKMLKAMYRIRLQEESRLSQVTSGDYSLFIYEKIIFDVKTKLKAKNYLKGEVNSSFDDKTLQAVLQYQKDNKIKETGMPTTETLYHLFMLNN